MSSRLLLIILFCFVTAASYSQESRVTGRITNSRLEPLPLVSIEVKDTRIGTTTKENGTFELFLDPGKYDLLISMIGFKPQVITIIVKNAPYIQNVILAEDETANLEEIVLKGRYRDPSESIIRNVIRKKESIMEAAGSYSCDVYIRATQQDSLISKKKKKKTPDTIRAKNPDADLYQMAMAEVVIRLDRNEKGQLKEERTAMTKRGNIESLFFLSGTEGDFNFYKNLVKAPVLSETPFLSPISYSGLLAYKFKLLKTEQQGRRKIFTISVKPREMSNATVQGEIVVMDSLWVLLQTRLSFPSYHLPEYDHFEVQQQYEWVKNTAWMITRQQFTYYSKNNRGKKSGQTIAGYQAFELQKKFPPGHFGTEISSTAQEAYEKDSSFWIIARTEPLTDKEIRFIHFKDSVFRATHTKAYLDSMDRVINKITWKKAFFTGQNFNNHEKERRWYLPPVTSIFQPFQFGGSRINLSAFYSRTFKSRKNIYVNTDLSYGIRNKDFNGSVNIVRLYNPFNRGFYSIHAGRRFDYIFEGDAWINMLKRSNVYLNNAAGVEHGLELINGLHLFTGLDISVRRSVSDYKINPKVDSLFGDVLDNNQPIAFEGYNALYGKIRLQYTPFQKYIREPREKIIIGSAWPTWYISLRKGIPGILQSKVDFDYLEFGMEQEIRAGLAGISKYSIRTGSFINTKDLRLVDYKWQRRGDPFLFMNPHEAFQSLDSTFAVFKRFYQGHFVHEFNGALLNKIPLLKKLQLREMGGAGFLIAQERNLRYMEMFAGIERVFKWPFDTDSKFKLGVYIVGSVANQFKQPVQLKIGITSWDKRRNKWY